MTPTALAPFPTTDGGPFHLENVPLVNYLTAPFYLFDPMDNVDKIHAASLGAADARGHSHHRVRRATSPPPRCASR